MKNTDRGQDENSGDVPDPELGASMGRLFRGVSAPEEVRASLRSEAEARFGPAAGLPGGRRTWRWQLIAGGLAAAATLAAVLLRDPGSGVRDAQPASTLVIAAQPAGPLDVDQSGRVDVFDAYLVARAVRAGATDGMPDADGDGAVTLEDAHAIAAKAVEVVR